MQHECHVIDKCRECTKHELIDNDVCEKTRKIERIECIRYQGDDEISSTKKFRSCKRTEADEEFLMMRLQMFCFLLGFMSLFSAKRQKRIHASLFDQRKAKAKQSPAHRTTSDQRRQQGLSVETEMVSLDSSLHSMGRARTRKYNKERKPLVGTGNTSGPGDIV
mmetsp:Transcript_19586/g.27707  ORF Transcript_19586/g.27707 Transcript_19586/m.27707 type:complete len:164 (+) Transcript_19586:78-569(+)